MNTKLEVLTESLKKKKEVLDEKIQKHFDTVSQANGQPLNDKRNGHKTLSQWEKQNDSIKNQMESIERTKNAIEKEEKKIEKVNGFTVPDFLIPYIESGEITQWRKYPNRFFVTGVEKGRIIWNKKKQKLEYSYLSQVPKDQIPKFKDVANRIYKDYSKEK